MLTGAIAPSSGRILLGGEDITKVNQAARVRRGLGRTFQVTTLFRSLPVLDNVALGIAERDGIARRMWKPASKHSEITDEAMQLLAMYPGGHATLVDYDPFCRDVRFAEFPDAYPFLGVDPATGHKRVWHKSQMDIDYVVSDIRDLTYGPEFDIVISVGLIEHFPDAYKPLALDFHRRFVKPNGWVLMTTPRDQRRTRAYYNIMSDRLNFGYRELMDVWQMGLYATENGFDIRRAGVIKAHNGLITKVRAAA